jgi:hypothetical protein
MNLDTMKKKYARHTIGKLYGMLKETVQAIGKIKDSQNGVVQCVTCGKIDRVEKMQGGHYIHAGRGYSETGVDVRNIHAQCVRCNYYENAQSDYHDYMLYRYGRERINQLKLLHKQVKKWTHDELIERVYDARAELKQLKKDKGLV